jgi:uncharacterized membrane protein (DUF4010 family)
MTIFPHEPDHLLTSLLVGASLGAMIGLERQWDDQFRHHRTRILAGLRTFTLWAVFGVLCAWFAQTVHVLLFAAGFAVVAVWMGFFLLSRSRSGGDPGLTTAAAGMITFLSGALVFWGEERPALVLTVGVLILLALKPSLHRFTRGITADDVRTSLKFAAVSGVILPLVPDEALGPYGAFNPRVVWMMVVLVSGVGFTGYVAVRLLGNRYGIVLTGLLGGLASSTATTLAMSRQSRERPAESRECSLAILLACTIMVWRVGFLAAVVSPGTFLAGWPYLLLVSLPGVLWCLIRILGGGQGSAGVKDAPSYGNPLRLRTALQFGLVYALVVLAVKATIARNGDAGLLVLSGLSGLVDLDAITLSVSQMNAGGGLPSEVAVRALLLAILANTVVKGLMASFYGSSALRKEVLAVLGITALFVLASCRFLSGHVP